MREPDDATNLCLGVSFGYILFVIIQMIICVVRPRNSPKSTAQSPVELCQFAVKMENGHRASGHTMATTSVKYSMYVPQGSKRMSTESDEAQTVLVL